MGKNHPTQLPFFHILSVLCVGLFAGLMMTLVVIMHKHWSKLEGKEYVFYFKGFLMIAKGNPFISLLTFGSFLIPLTLGVVCILLNNTLSGILFLFAGAIFFLSCFLVTMKLNFPIYNKVIGWTGINDATDWKNVRYRFFILNIIRMSGAILSFALLSIIGLIL
jgi:uncharacterized membrane protein